MDYRNYKNLMERYHGLSEFTPAKNETEDGLIKKLMDISYAKKQIFNEANDIIRDYIEKYEKNPDLLDKEVADMLNDFLLLITLESGYPLDLPISLRILGCCFHTISLCRIWSELSIHWIGAPIMTP